MPATNELASAATPPAPVARLRAGEADVNAITSPGRIDRRVGRVAVGADPLCACAGARRRRGRARRPARERRGVRPRVANVGPGCSVGVGVADADVFASSISGSGDCVAFDGNFTNLNDGFASSDFGFVHLRVLRQTCPGAPGTTGRPRRDGQPGATGSPARRAAPARPAPPVRAALAVWPGQDYAAAAARDPKPERADNVAQTLPCPGAQERHGRSLHALRAGTGAPAIRPADQRPSSRGTRCAAGRRGTACTIITRIGTLTLTGHAGRNQIHFEGKVLRPGRYRLTATPARGAQEHVAGEHSR
jgi:hypothetical protein